MVEIVINQFIRFDSVRPEYKDKCDIALPIVLRGGKPSTTFYYYANQGDKMAMEVLRPDGQSTQISRVLTSANDGWHICNIGHRLSDTEMDREIGDGNLFCIMVENITQDITVYSQLLQYKKSLDGLCLLTYGCNEDAFGMPFANAGASSVVLPISLSNPQYLQEDKVYTKSTGENVVLYAQYKKEWDAETEYLPEEWHDSIMTALSCDNIHIETGDINYDVSKNGDYEVDWDNYDQLPDGTKIAKGKVKLQANISSRNSNY